MKQKSPALGYILFLFGIALIFTGFFIIFPEEKRNNIFWLNLIVICLIYFLNFANLFGLLGIYFDFNKQIAGLGMRLAYLRLYNLFAIGVITICWYKQVDFKYQLYLQLIGLFFLGVLFFLSRLSTSHAASVQEEQNQSRRGKEDILKSIHQLELLFSKDSAKWSSEKQKVELLKENVRYLSPTDNHSAVSLDNEIILEIKKAYDYASTKNEGGTEFISFLSRCEDLLKQRKNIYSN